MARDGALIELEEVLGYRFGDVGLLRQALRHGSAETSAEAGSYQRLEFLGDAVLGNAMALLLYETFPEDDQGMLTRKRAHLARSVTLAQKAALIGLDGYVEVGPSEESSRGRERTALLEDLFEAVVGAILLDGGWGAAVDFVERQFGVDIDTLDEETLMLADAKTALQEAAQARGLELPRYVQQRTSGPDHRRRWVYEVEWDGGVVARGEGPTKREAQQQAARRALQRLGVVSADRR